MKVGDKVRILEKNCDLLGRSIMDSNEPYFIEKIGPVSTQVRSESGWEYLIRNTNIET